MSTLSTSKILICIYTCEQDIESLNKLKQTQWYKKYSNYKNIKIIDVYADENINDIYNYNNNELTVKTEEAYRNLSIKTYRMISACVDLFEFDYLIKVDSAIIKDIYRANDHRFSFDYFVKKFSSAKIISEYGGCCPILGTTSDLLESWATKKGMESSPSLFFMTLGREPPQHYWAGSCYCLSKDNCEKILNQEYIFEKAKDYMCGIEDLSVGLAVSN
jgi:hypothetical protein